LSIINFTDFGLIKPIQRALKERNYINPTPIQIQSIPTLLRGRDFLGIAQTGTGKTAAFALPIINILSKRKGSKKHRQPCALILAPTRELAIQINEELSLYSKYLPLKNTVVFGGVRKNNQVAALKNGADILVATPGRLLDLKRQGIIQLGKIEILVLDEADRMLDMGFIVDVKKIISALPLKRQSLLFSATMPKEVDRLSTKILHKPVRVEITRQAKPIERIKQYLRYVRNSEKNKVLAEVLSEPGYCRVIVFSRTKHRANKVAIALSNVGIAADAIHGNKSQNARQRALKKFRAGDIRVLVATDIAARGIDVNDITHVINYELPNEAENYVHRIGRTARAGANGTALSFCDNSELSYLRGIEKLIGNRLTVIGGEPDPVANTPNKKPLNRQAKNLNQSRKLRSRSKSHRKGLSNSK
jgi:ATP-dependent RNA helicase RhlE